MKIGIPVLEENGMDSPLSQHFGQAEIFAILDDSTDELTFIKNDGQHHGGILLPPDLLNKSGVNVMLCGGLGVKAVQLFQQFGIQVYCNASGTVGKTLEAFKAGKLPEASESTACQHHGH